jgi:hypothetical protein
MGPMTDKPQNNPILKRFRAALDEMYGAGRSADRRGDGSGGWP